MEEEQKLHEGQMVYYARIMPTLGIYDVYDMKVSSVRDTYFAVTEKRDKRRFIFYYKDIGNTIFTDRKTALEKAIEEESKNKKQVSEETYYEEY